MSENNSWENECCRCGPDVQVNLYPGKRACHISCGPCMYPDNPNCTSCEIVGHCMYAVSYLKELKANGISKGCYFTEQLTGEETLYHTLKFVNSQQILAKELGESQYLEELRKINSTNPCVRRMQVPLK